MIPYELVKIYRDEGIDLMGYSVDYNVYNDYTESYEDNFLYGAF